jgi:aryl-alcohol dehydrogenase-like predicted oxidoreductase
VEIADRKVGRVGLGTNRLSDSPENRRFIREAVEAGLGHIDTAHLYSGGDSERTIGAALGGDADVLVATKAGYNGKHRKHLREEVEQSLRSLRVESIDLLYLHRTDPKLSIEESLALVEELCREGKVRHVGISEVSIGQIGRAKQVLPIAAVQNEYSLKEREHDEVVDFCSVEGIAFVPFFPLRGGGRAVDEIAEAHGATPNQIKIAWLLKRSPAMAPIPGTLSLAHLKENLGAAEIPLSDDEFERLAKSG